MISSESVQYLRGTNYPAIKIMVLLENEIHPHSFGKDSQWMEVLKTSISLKYRLLMFNIFQSSDFFQFFFFSETKRFIILANLNDATMLCLTHLAIYFSLLEYDFCEVGHI